MIKLRMEDLPGLKKKPCQSSRRPAWYKAEQEDRDKYTIDLQAKLSQLTVPASLQCSDVHCSDPVHSEQRDGFVIDMMSSVIESSHANIPMSGGKKYHHDPNRSCPVEENIPGWKEMVLLHFGIECGRVWESVGECWQA